MSARKKKAAENALEIQNDNEELLYLAETEDEAASLEITTRFLRERENRLDRQTLRLAQALIRAGFKVTDPRLAIIEEIVNFNQEFEINELAKRFEARSDFKPGVASVFRTVKLLVELGLLQRVHAGDGRHRYGLVRGHNHQVICRCCDRSIEFEGCDFTDLTSFLEKQTGFKLEGHWMEFYGLCGDCRKAEVETAHREGLPVTPLAPHKHHSSEETTRPAPLNVSAVSQTPV